jgi:DNA modification methylase
VHRRLARRKVADQIAKQVGTVPLQKVVCADCLDYLRGFTKPMSHASVYDPPFGIGYRYQGFVDPDNPKDYWKWFRPRYEEIRRVTLPGGAIIFWQAERYKDFFREWFGEHRLFYAVKRNASLLPKGSLVNCEPTPAVDLIVMQWKEGANRLLPERQDWSYNYFVTDLTFSDGLIHPCPRPMDLCEVIVRNWTVENGIILDAFTGSGQIPLAVGKVGGGRKFVAVEVVPEYAAEAERRLIEAAGG